jgi:hypothetical protein
MYPKSCKKTTFMHHAQVGEESFEFSYGIMEFTAKQVAAGESFDVVTEWDWGNKDAGHDWSVTAYGDKAGSTLSITHKGGLKT